MPSPSSPTFSKLVCPLLSLLLSPLLSSSPVFFSDASCVVGEFQAAVESKPASSLRYQLKLERRLDDDDRRVDALRMLTALKNLAKFSDWKSLVSDSYHKEIEAAFGSEKEMIAKAPGSLPEEGIYYDVEAAAVMNYFQTNYESGLSSGDIPPRIAKYDLSHVICQLDY